MLKLLKSWLGPYLQLSLVLLALTFTASCSSINPLTLLTGSGGPNINGQIGKENYQGVTTTIDKSIRPVIRPEAPVETIHQDNSTTNNTEIDPLVLMLLILGWLLPSPAEMGRGLLKIFRRNK